jgi:hypothetical protein
MIFHQLRKKNKNQKKKDSVFLEHHTTNIDGLTGSDGAGILTKAGRGGAPPFKAFVAVRAVTTDRRRRGVSARDAMVLRVITQQEV